MLSNGQMTQLPQDGSMYTGGGGGGGGSNGGSVNRPNVSIEYSPHSSHPPSAINGLMSGGTVCSQLNLNQNCPPNPVCSGCTGPILDRFLLHTVDRYWHHNCLVCTACGATLADIGNSCFTRDGLFLCKSDYLRIFGRPGTCGTCGQGIPPTEFVMRAGNAADQLVYHMKCFMCTKCGLKLNPGDRYSVLNGSLFCESDALKVMKNGIGSPSANVGANSPAPTRKGKVGRPRRSRD